jgi:hypothetical protein
MAPRTSALTAAPVFQPQPQAAPLNEEGQQSVLHLLQNDTARKRLQGLQAKAARILREVAGNANDKAFDARARHAKKLQRLEEAEGEEPDEELDEYNEYQNQVKDVTQRLDVSLRGIVDDGDWLASVPEALRAVAVKSGAVAEETQRTENTIPMTTQRSRRAADDEDDDFEMSEEGARPTTTQIDPADAPTAQLRSAFETQASTWAGLSLTERYAQSNHYRDFYRTIHDSKHRDRDEVPVPHESMWFAAEEGRRTESAVITGTGNDMDDDDELQIGRVVIRTKCPITMKDFEDPVTSKKCPHSFESSAFYEILKRTDKHLPFTPEQVQEIERCRNRLEKTKKEKEIRIPAVQCPECRILLTSTDVERNTALQRKVQRMIAEKKQREREVDEDSEDEDDVPRGTQRKPVGLGSSPPSGRASGRVCDFKAESGREARPPGTQTTTAGATVVDLGEEDDDEEMDDE